MSSKYTKTQIEWAKAEIKKKRPGSNPTQEQAIKLLDTFDKFSGMVFDKVNKYTKKNKTELSN